MAYSLAYYIYIYIIQRVKGPEDLRILGPKEVGPHGHIASYI